MPKTVAGLITKFTYKEIKQTFKKARCRYTSPELDIKVSPKTDNIGKLLIVIPKKVGVAPERNLMRRRLKSIFYQNQLFNYPFNVLVFCKPSILNLAYQNLEEKMLTSIQGEH